MRDPELLQSLFAGMYPLSCSTELFKAAHEVWVAKEITLMTKGSEHGMGLGISLLRTVLCGFGFADRMFESFSHCGC